MRYVIVFFTLLRWMVESFRERERHRKIAKLAAAAGFVLEQPMEGIVPELCRVCDSTQRWGIYAKETGEHRGTLCFGCDEARMIGAHGFRDHLPLERYTAELQRLIEFPPELARTLSSLQAQRVEALEERDRQERFVAQIDGDIRALIDVHLRHGAEQSDAAPDFSAELVPTLSLA